MNALYDDILRITREYMGVVAESFVKRRCKNSLDLENPYCIEGRHIEPFAQGVARTGEVYMKPEKVREFATALMKLKEKYPIEKSEDDDANSIFKTP